MDTFEAILARRSIGRLVEPGPTGRDLDHILQAALAAPDHGELRPWKLVILAGEAKDAFGAVLADAYVERCQSL
ncbi:MAG TPA: nitroreductase family protein, partial [Acidimicrobiales bacterium]|nr:nitroreductase family protein [Acidimicrobiales bacterium]